MLESGHQHQLGLTWPLFQKPLMVRYLFELNLNLKYFKSVSNYVKPTSSIFSNGLPDQYTVVAVFETNLSIKSWARDYS